MSTPESDMERALADANELSNRFISSASQFRLTEADTLNVIGVCRALIACREPVRITRRKQTLGHADRIECGSCHWEVATSANYCAHCGSRILWTN